MTANFPRRIVRLLTAISFSAILLGCSDDHTSFEKGGSSFALVSHDVNDPCRVMVTDMGRASPPVKSFSARMEGCK
jgi:hypothetical protein